MHALLTRALGGSGAHLASHRKYVDDLVLRRALASAGVVLNPKKTVVVANGPAAGSSVAASPVGFYYPQFGGGPWRNSGKGWEPPAGHVETPLSGLGGLPESLYHKDLTPQALHGAQVGVLADRHLQLRPGLPWAAGRLASGHRHLSTYFFLIMAILL